MVSVQPCNKQAMREHLASEFQAVNQVCSLHPSSPTPSTAASSATSTTTRTATVAFQDLATQPPCNSNSHSTISRSSEMHSWWEGLEAARAREFRSRDHTSSRWARRWAQSSHRSGRIYSSSWLFQGETPRCQREWNPCLIGLIICQSSLRLR